MKNKKRPREGVGLIRHSQHDKDGDNQNVSDVLRIKFAVSNRDKHAHQNDEEYQQQPGQHSAIGAKYDNRERAGIYGDLS